MPTYVRVADDTRQRAFTVLKAVKDLHYKACRVLDEPATDEAGNPLPDAPLPTKPHHPVAAQTDDKAPAPAGDKSGQKANTQKEQV